MPRAKFWENGIRFECQGSGRCCMSRGAYGYVYLTLEDRQRMARVLELSEPEFTGLYCEETLGYIHLKHPEKDCQFLVDGKSCGVYEGRPTQCRTWPFWPENMNARIWNKEVAPFCAGVGKGRLHSPEEIQRILEQQKASVREL